VVVFCWGGGKFWYLCIAFTQDGLCFSQNSQVGGTVRMAQQQNKFTPRDFVAGCKSAQAFPNCSDKLLVSGFPQAYAFDFEKP